jgi:LuxR family maltose regulon positive regulatory protein
MGTLEEWLSWFGEDELANYPALAVYRAWLRVLTGRPDEAERWLALADGAISVIPLSDGSATIAPWVATLRAHMMGAGVDQALVDANLALEQLSSESVWIPVALGARGTAHALLGATERAAEDFAATIESGLASGAFEDVVVAQSHLALLAIRRGDWDEASRYAQTAQALVGEMGLGDYSTSALPNVVGARIALHEGRRDDARAALARTHRLRPLLDHGLPWLTVEVGLELVRAHLALGEAAAASTVLSETERVIELRPDLGSLVADARELRERVAATEGPAGAWAMSLTGAELRLLPYLATHLTFPEIASRLFISRNTVKTEAVAIYRKLTASSRSEAIERAIEVGLLEGSVLPPRASLARKSDALSG